MAGALDGVRVVDLTTTVAGATCTMLLADFGAEVLRLADAEVDAERNAPAFVALDRGKTRVAVDRSDPEQVGRVVAGADVVVTAISDREVAGAAALEGLLAQHPSLIVVRMPPFAVGSEGPRDVESAGLVTASTGLGMRQYSTAGVPVDPVYPHVLYAQGAWAAVCTVAALIERLTSRRGQTVTVGGEHGAMIAAFATFGDDPESQPLPPPGPGGPNPFYSRYETSDGTWLFLGSLTVKFQRIALATLGIADLLDDSRIAGDLDATGTPANRDWVRARFEQAFRSRTGQDWLAALRAADCPVGELLRRDDWLDHPQIGAIGMRAEFVHPEVGAVVSPGVPLRLSETTARVPRAEKAAAVEDLPAAPVAAESITSAARPKATAGRGPLAGMRVLNLGVVLAGPLAGNLLAELGADVVKIEPPAGDPFRDKGFHYNRGMRSLAVDLRAEGGRDAFLHLVRESDVVIDNFRSGVLERLGVDHASLREVNPGVSSVSVTGFGTEGPLSEEPGFDPVLGAMSGMMFAQGGEDEPVMITLAINDVSAGVMVTLASCLTLYARLVHGAGGQRGSTSLAAASAFAQSGELVRFAGRPPAQRGGADYLGPSFLERAYRVADGWVRIHARPEEAAKLVETGLVSTGDSEAQKAKLESALSTCTMTQALGLLRGVGIAAVPARTMGDATRDPEALAGELFHPLAKDGGGHIMVPGRLVRFSRTEQAGILRPPGLGEHTREVLADFGIPSEEIDALVDAGIVVEGRPMRFASMPGYR